MSRPPIAAALLALSLALPAGAARAQQPAPGDGVARGLELYRKGDDEGAAKLLREELKRDPGNAEGWYYLGLALNRGDRVKDARNAFRKAVELRPDHARARSGLAYALLRGGRPRDAEAEARRAVAADANQAEPHYVLGAALLASGREEEAAREADAALALNPRLAAAHVLKGSALANLYVERFNRVMEQHSIPERPGTERAEALARRREALDALDSLLADAAAAFESALTLEPASPQAAHWREQAETLRAYSTPDADGPFRGTEVTTKAVILEKPEPQYPEAARREGVTGVVRLRAALGPDARVRHLFILRSPDPRLAQAAARAARLMKFKPATKDGRPVSQWVVLEYAFNIY